MVHQIQSLVRLSDGTHLKLLSRTTGKEGGRNRRIEMEGGGEKERENHR